MQTLAAEKRQLTESNKALLQSLEGHEDAKRKVTALKDELRLAEEEREEELRMRKEWEAMAASLKKELGEAKEEVEDLKRDGQAMEKEAAAIDTANQKLKKG